MSTCRACEARFKDWNGDDPKCAFPDGQAFNASNWRCATLGLLRAQLYDTYYGSEDTRICHHNHDGDQHMVSLNVGDVDLASGPALTLWLSWYKDRGRTEAAWLLTEDTPPRLPTEQDMLTIYEAFR